MMVFGKMDMPERIGKKGLCGPDGGSCLIAAGLKRNAGMVVLRDERDYGIYSMTLDMPQAGLKEEL